VTRARLVIVALATVVLAGILPGSSLVAVVPSDDEVQEPVALPPDTADRVGTARVVVRDLDGKVVPFATVRALFVPRSAWPVARRGRSFSRPAW